MLSRPNSYEGMREAELSRGSSWPPMGLQIRPQTTLQADLALGYLQRIYSRLWDEEQAGFYISTSASRWLWAGPGKVALPAQVIPCSRGRFLVKSAATPGQRLIFPAAEGAGASALKRGCKGVPQNPLEGKRCSLQVVASDKYPASHRRWSRIGQGMDILALETGPGNSLLGVKRPRAVRRLWARLWPLAYIFRIWWMVQVKKSQGLSEFSSSASSDNFDVVFSSFLRFK